MEKKQSSLRMIFMGTSSFATIILRALCKNKCEIISVYTRPDKKIGRNQEILKSPVKLFAEEKNLKIIQPEKFDEKTIKELKKQKPDVIIVAAYGKILPEAVLAVPRFGPINVHASLLPKFRGPSPIQNAIYNGENETGATIMLMDKGVDTGNILSQKEINIKVDDLYPDVLHKIAGFSAKLLIKTLPLWKLGKIIPKKQNERKATYCRLIKRDDGRINWKNEAFSIYNMFRAFYPWPGIFTFWDKNGKTFRIKLHKISLVKNNLKNNLLPGTVFRLGEQTAVQTPRGMIILEEIQIEGKPRMKLADFLNGYPQFLGSVLK